MNHLQDIDINVINKANYIPDYLYLDYSNLSENIGIGIFCKNKIEKNTFLGHYLGDIYIGETCNVTNCKYNFGTTMSNQKCIICAEGNNSNWTKYMNSSLGDQTIENVLALYCPNKDTYITEDDRKINLNGYVLFYAKRNIDIGEELLFNYGDKYNAY